MGLPFESDIFADLAAPPAQETVRRATLADVPVLLEIAKELYADRPVANAESWLRWAIQNPERLVLIGKASAGVAQLSWNYGFERRARLDALGALPGRASAFEALRIVRLMIQWARENGATGTFRLDADTGVDFGPFARRLGGKPVTHTRYEIPL